MNALYYYVRSAANRHVFTDLTKEDRQFLLEIFSNPIELKARKFSQKKRISLNGQSYPLYGLRMGHGQIRFTDRILFTYYQQKIIILGYVQKHQYNKAACMDDDCFKQILSNLNHAFKNVVIVDTVDSIEQEKADASSVDIDNLDELCLDHSAQWLPAYCKNQQFLVANEQQKAILNRRFSYPLFLDGAPGTGKTLTVQFFFERFVEDFELHSQSGDQTPKKIVYVYPQSSRPLGAHMRTVWEESNLVDYMQGFSVELSALSSDELVPAELRKNYLDSLLSQIEVLFQQGLKKGNKVNSKNSWQYLEQSGVNAKIIFQYLMIMGVFPDYERCEGAIALRGGMNLEILSAIRQIFDQQISRQPEFARLFALFQNPIANSKRYFFLVIDEVQNFDFPVLIWLLFQTENHQIIFSGDERQAAQWHSISLLDFVKKYCYFRGINFSQSSLTRQHRCPLTIWNHAQKIQPILDTLFGNVIKNSAINQDDCLHSGGHLSVIDWKSHECKELIAKIPNHSPDFFVITPVLDTIKSLLAQDFPEKKLISFHPKEVAGLEVQTAIIIYPIDWENVWNYLEQSARTYRDKKDSKQKKQVLSKRAIELYEQMNQYFVALTRATENVIIIDAPFDWQRKNKESQVYEHFQKIYEQLIGSIHVTQDRATILNINTDASASNVAERLEQIYKNLDTETAERFLQEHVKEHQQSQVFYAQEKSPIQIKNTQKCPKISAFLLKAKKCHYQWDQVWQSHFDTRYLIKVLFDKYGETQESLWERGSKEILSPTWLVQAETPKAVPAENFGYVIESLVSFCAQQGFLNENFYSATLEHDSKKITVLGYLIDQSDSHLELWQRVHKIINLCSDPNFQTRCMTKSLLDKEKITSLEMLLTGTLKDSRDWRSMQVLKICNQISHFFKQPALSLENHVEDFTRVEWLCRLVSWHSESDYYVPQLRLSVFFEMQAKNTKDNKNAFWQYMTIQRLQFIEAILENQTIFLPPIGLKDLKNTFCVSPVFLQVALLYAPADVRAYLLQKYLQLIPEKLRAPDLILKARLGLGTECSEAEIIKDLEAQTDITFLLENDPHMKQKKYRIYSYFLYEAYQAEYPISLLGALFTLTKQYARNPDNPRLEQISQIIADRYLSQKRHPTSFRVSDAYLNQRDVNLSQEECKNRTVHESRHLYLDDSAFEQLWLEIKKNNYMLVSFVESCAVYTENDFPETQQESSEKTDLKLTQAMSEQSEPYFTQDSLEDIGLCLDRDLSEESIRDVDQTISYALTNDRMNIFREIFIHICQSSLQGHLNKQKLCEFFLNRFQPSNMIFNDKILHYVTSDFLYVAKDNPELIRSVMRITFSFCFTDPLRNHSYKKTLVETIQAYFLGSEHQYMRYRTPLLKALIAAEVNFHDLFFDFPDSQLAQRNVFLIKLFVHCAYIKNELIAIEKSLNKNNLSSFDNKQNLQLSFFFQKCRDYLWDEMDSFSRESMSFFICKKVLSALVLVAHDSNLNLSDSYKTDALVYRLRDKIFQENLKADSHFRSSNHEVITRFVIFDAFSDIVKFENTPKFFDQLKLNCMALYQYYGIEEQFDDDAWKHSVLQTQLMYAAYDTHALAILENLIAQTDYSILQLPCIVHSSSGAQATNLDYDTRCMKYFEHYCADPAHYDDLVLISFESGLDAAAYILATRLVIMPDLFSTRSTLLNFFINQHGLQALIRSPVACHFLLQHEKKETYHKFREILNDQISETWLTNSLNINVRVCTEGFVFLREIGFFKHMQILFESADRIETEYLMSADTQKAQALQSDSKFKLFSKIFMIGTEYAEQYPTWYPCHVQWLNQFFATLLDQIIHSVLEEVSLWDDYAIRMLRSMLQCQRGIINFDKIEAGNTYRTSILTNLIFRKEYMINLAFPVCLSENDMMQDVVDTNYANALMGFLIPSGIIRMHSVFLYIIKILPTLSSEYYDIYMKTLAVFGFYILPQIERPEYHAHAKVFYNFILRADLFSSEIVQKIMLPFAILYPNEVDDIVGAASSPISEFKESIVASVPSFHPLDAQSFQIPRLAVQHILSITRKLYGSPAFFLEKRSQKDRERIFQLFEQYGELSKVLIDKEYGFVPNHTEQNKIGSLCHLSCKEKLSFLQSVLEYFRNDQSPFSSINQKDYGIFRCKALDHMLEFLVNTKHNQKKIVDLLVQWQTLEDKMHMTTLLPLVVMLSQWNETDPYEWTLCPQIIDFDALKRAVEAQMSGPIVFRSMCSHNQRVQNDACVISPSPVIFSSVKATAVLPYSDCNLNSVDSAQDEKMSPGIPQL